MWPFANVAIATGAASGIDVLDLDISETENGLETLEEIAAEFGGHLPPAPFQQTGGGGQQIFFRYSGKIKGRARFAPGLDTRSTGNYTIMPPSVHATGRLYEWGIHPDETAPPDMPKWLIDAINKRQPATKRITRKARGERTERDFERMDPEKILQGVAMGARNTTLFRYACSMRQRAFKYEEARALILRAAAACLPPMDEREALACLDSAWKYPAPGDDGWINLTDAGNAERLIRAYGEDLLYCPQTKSWYIWTGTHWAPDRTERIQELAVMTVRKIMEEAKAYDDKDMRARLVKHAMSSESRRAIEAMISLARSKVSIEREAFDQDRWVLNCRNGTVDLRTGELRPHDREARLTMICPWDYEPGKEPKLWLEFLRTAMDGDEELIDFLQRAWGYSITGSVQEQVLFICYGLGRNGKSTALEVIRGVLGDYAANAPFEAFLLSDVSRSGQATPEIARLAGARYVTAIEADPGRRLNEALIKSVTGGDRITVRMLYQQPFEMDPTFHLWLACNHKPHIRGQDEAIWRRIRLIPWNVQIPPNKVDPKLRDKLLSEAPAILAWLVEGCLRYQAEGLDPVEAVVEATSEYREEMDELGEFINSKCLVDVRCSQDAGSLYAAYKDWCEESGARPLSQRAFGLRMTERGFARKRSGSRGQVVYQGIGLMERAG